jgi:hypothetical protein
MANVRARHSHARALVALLALLGLGATAIGADAAGADSLTRAKTTAEAAKPTPPTPDSLLGNLAEDPLGNGPGSYHSSRRTISGIAPESVPASTPPETPLGDAPCEGYSATERSNPRETAIQDIMTFPPFDLSRSATAMAT